MFVRLEINYTRSHRVQMYNSCVLLLMDLSLLLRKYVNVCQGWVPAAALRS